MMCEVVDRGKLHQEEAVKLFFIDTLLWDLLHINCRLVEYCISTYFGSRDALL